MEISDELSSSDEKTPEKLPTEQEKFRSFVLFLSGQFASLFGSSVVMFAIIWWITVETGSALFLFTGERRKASINDFDVSCSYLFAIDPHPP